MSWCHRMRHKVPDGVLYSAKVSPVVVRRLESVPDQLWPDRDHFVVRDIEEGRLIVAIRISGGHHIARVVAGEEEVNGNIGKPRSSITVQPHMSTNGKPWSYRNCRCMCPR